MIYQTLFDADWNNNALSMTMRDMVTVEQAQEFANEDIWNSRGKKPIEPNVEYAEDFF